MNTPAKERVHFVVILRPEPHVVDSTKALRGALKTVLRQWGLRAIMVDVEHQAGEQEETNG
jgi:hypothetical protein